ncbi:30S ribosomal protein S9 [Candidatus Micrarchaeota archaeon]|nr:30S ribosomal protein S9 [Candidatus Micrarchaeota archaeon]MBD3418083.1 30S ribosomal protein S9 [Candidatus Micrarchaeota archaeon]
MAEKKTTAKKKTTRKKTTKKSTKNKAEPKKEEAENEEKKEEKKPEKPKPVEKPEPKKIEEKKEEAKPKAKKARKPKKKKKSVRVEHSRGKRKRAIARATVKEGSGRIRVNSKLISSVGNRYFRSIVSEPLELLGPDGLKVDINVKVRGGGEMGQAQACRTAIAKALAQYFGEGVLAKYNEDDRYLLREDPRRVEPKKYMGPKARARDQKSYR